ncbi:MAG TPA: cytochrome b/b6 domain-containing protein [Bryobacteraceae bacterium]|nr:cytochrome b/b6 domain-containing protein [Bryobacteraceae bacterium]
MADSAWAPDKAVFTAASDHTRHTALVRVTHWITAICFLALLVTGAEIVISHPRFYWGETGNVLTAPLFKLPIPASRRLVQTGYGYVLPDQNGWSRALHFQAAWALVFTGALYLTFGLLSWHFAKNLLPRKADLSPRTLATMIGSHLRSVRQDPGDGSSYNPLQKLSYVLVIFVLFPLVIWTGLAMSPAFVSAFPGTVTLLGGQQSARTIHFFVSLALLLFLVIHIAMICVAGFKSRVVAMITGRTATHQEHI